MNLSKQSGDKELFSGERSSNENTENNPKKTKMTNKEVTTDSESNDEPDMMYNDSIENRIINCVKDCNIFDDTTNKSRVNSRFTSRYPTEKDYQDSFDDIISFRNSLTEKERNGIDVIMYNENNNDGMISAYIAWLYFKENKSNKLPIFVKVFT